MSDPLAHLDFTHDPTEIVLGEAAVVTMARASDLPMKCLNCGSAWDSELLDHVDTNSRVGPAAVMVVACVKCKTWTGRSSRRHGAAQLIWRVYVRPEHLHAVPVRRAPEVPTPLRPHRVTGQIATSPRSRRAWPYALEHPTHGGSDRARGIEPILSGPLLVRSRNSTRWHRPRSGTHYGPDAIVPDRIAWSFWCGSGCPGGCMAIVTLPTDGGPICGTCEGRAVGAGYGPVASPVEAYPTVFSPHSARIPKRCPGSRTELLVEVGPRINRGRCLVCGSIEKVGAGGGWYHPSWGLANHPPGPDLIAGCGWHGRRELILVDGAIACRCGPLP